MTDIKELLEDVEEHTQVELEDILREDCWDAEDVSKVKNLMKTLWYSMSIKKDMGISTSYSTIGEGKKPNV